MSVVADVEVYLQVEVKLERSTINVSDTPHCGRLGTGTRFKLARDRPTLGHAKARETQSNFTGRWTTLSSEFLERSSSCIYIMLFGMIKE